MTEETLMRAETILSEIKSRESSVNILKQMDSGYGPAAFVSFKMNLPEDEVDLNFIREFVKQMIEYQQQRIENFKTEFKKL